jgi:Lrp/AsnC family transcriptional regulator, regulator for asnA, asnC and gidA
MSQMILGLANKQISAKLKIPLSTVQRRTRKLIEAGIVAIRAEVNFEKLGIKSGMIHIYLRDGIIDKLANKISTIDTITSTEVHVGNSDLIANVQYRNSMQLLQTISNIKHIEGVDRIVWSEKIYDVRNNNTNFINSLLDGEN